MISSLILLLFINTSRKYDLPVKWKSFCEKHLVADDPYDKDDDDFDDWTPQ